MRMDKIKNWVHLSEEGKKELGHIFGDKLVPTINVLVPSGATLEGQKGVVRVWKIDISKLTGEQFERCLDYIYKKRNGDKEVIRRDLTEMGFIPLQDRYVSGSGTTQVGMFL